MKRWLGVVIPGLLLLAAVALRVPAFGVNDWPLMQELRYLVFDSYQRTLPRVYRAEVPVRIVDIDEESLRKFGQWPWPRSLLAQLVDRLADAGALVVVFDILLAEPDRMAPASILSQLGDQPDLRSMTEVLAKMPDPDAELAASMGHTRTVTAFALNQEPGTRKPAEKWGEGSIAGDDPYPFVRQRYVGALTTLPAIEAAAQGNGSVNFVPEFDTTIRRVPLFALLDNRLYPGLAAEAVRVAYGAQNYEIKASGASGEWNLGQSTGIVAVRIDRLIVPTDPEGTIRLYDSGHRRERFVSAWEILGQSFPRQLVAGNIVLIGSSAAAVQDLKTTPIEPVMAGVEVHAQVIEQILGSQFLQRPDWSDGAELAFLLVFGLVLIFAIRLVGALLTMVLGLAGIGCAVALSWYGFTHFGYLIDPLYPCLVALLVYLSGSLLGYLDTESEKRFVRDAMGRYVSPHVVAQITRDRTRLALGGELRELTVLFSDIRGFTRIAEGLPPKDLTNLINRFLTPLTRVIQESGGTVDKYMGDCIMAFWNAPLDVPEHPRKAVRAALAMRGELHALNEMLHAEAMQKEEAPIMLNAGIGLNTGDASVGNMGSEQHQAYSAIGDTVNIASRLEGLSRVYDLDIVMGEETARHVQDFALLELDEVRVKGREAPLRVFTALGDENNAATHLFATLAASHVAMLAAYRQQDWSAARAALNVCRPMSGSLAGLYAVYEQRITRYEAAPPPADWDGVFTAETKQG